MKPVIFCLADKISNDKIDKYSKIYLDVNNFDYNDIFYGQHVASPNEIIKNEIETSGIFNNVNLINVIDHAKNNKGKIHLIGNINKDEYNTIYAILKLVKSKGFKDAYLHLFYEDKYNINSLIKEMKNIGIGTVCDVTEIKNKKVLYDTIVRGKNEENIGIGISDTIIFFNNKLDNLSDIITNLLTLKSGNSKKKSLKNIKILTMFSYNKLSSMYELPKYDTLGSIVSDNNLKQLRYNMDNYAIDGYKNIKYKGEKVVNSIDNVDMTKFDLSILNLKNEKELDLILNKFNKDCFIVILSKEKVDGKSLLAINHKKSLRTDDITKVGPTILELLNIKGLGKSLITHKKELSGLIFRISSLILILIFMMYYIIRFLYFYIVR